MADLAPQTEAIIDEYMNRFPGSSVRASARYYEEVHQALAPFCRDLEASHRRLIDIASLVVHLSEHGFPVDVNLFDENSPLVDAARDAIRLSPIPATLIAGNETARQRVLRHYAQAGYTRAGIRAEYPDVTDAELDRATTTATADDR